MADAQIGRLSVALVGSSGGFSETMNKATADAEKFAAGLQRQINASGMAGRSIEAYELRLRGASDAAVQRVEQLQSEVAAINAQADAERKAAAEREQIMRRGEAVTKSVMTAAEQYRAKMNDLRSMLQAGAISQETFNRALRQMHTPAEAVVRQTVGLKGEVHQLTAASGKSTYAIQQLAFGLQDAATVAGTQGFAGAVRASSNNIIQFASLIHPLAGTIAALAGTGLALAVDHFYKTGDSARKASEDILLLMRRMDEAERHQYFAPTTGMKSEAAMEKATRDIGRETNPETLARQADDMRAESEMIKRQQEERKRLIIAQKDLIRLAETRAATMTGHDKTEALDWAERSRKELEALSQEQKAARQRLQEINGFRGKEGLLAVTEAQHAAALEEEANKRRIDNFARQAEFERKKAEEAFDAEKKRTEEIARLKKSLIGEDDSTAGKIKQEQEKLKERIEEIRRLFAPGPEQQGLIDQAVQNADQRLKAMSGGSRAVARNMNIFAGTAEYGSAAAYSRVVQANAPREKSDTDKNTAKLVEQGRQQIREMGRIVQVIEDNVMGVFSI